MSEKIDESKFKYYEIEKQFENGFVARPEIPDYILSNMNPNFKIREYQENALENFIAYFKDSRFNHNKQVWNLFHMATGSGKTFIMASLILYLYKQGYRNFLFYVNQTNIVAKTRANFLDETSSKYLFADKIVIDKQTVNINTVTTFQDEDDDGTDINIMFTTMQDLHTKLNNIAECAVSYNDFNDKKIVLISDEAHHINSATKKKLSNAEKEDNSNWEDTVNNIVRANKENVLLEFTATCDLKDDSILEKYSGNPAEIVFNYPLLKFRASGYTKDLYNLKTTLDPITRTVQAMLLSQYRLKLFEDNHISNMKPVILLKSVDSTDNCDVFFEDFQDFMKNRFSSDTITIIRNQAKDVIKTMFDYYDTKGLSDEDLMHELKAAFTNEQMVKVHSKVKNLPELQIQLNELEKPTNPIRMVFTVDMLHEGWDVLNLFDIVRLYDIRKDGKKVSPVTIQEAQLIGRGARYCPFKLDTDIIGAENELFKRKFDAVTDNELRVCETLYYHCLDESRYISDLKRALSETGFNFSEDATKFEYKLKSDFKATKFYQNGKLFVNSYVEKAREDINEIPESFSIMCDMNLIKKSSTAALYEDEEDEKDDIVPIDRTYKICDIDKRIVMKALRQFPVYNFSRLQSYFPHLKSHTEFITSTSYMGRYEFTIHTKEEPTNLDIYQGVLRIAEILSNKILTIKNPLNGTHEFRELQLSDYIKDVQREKVYDPDEVEEKEGEGISQNAPSVNKDYRMDLSDKDWFAYEDNFGTTEEKRFVKYFSTHIDDLKKKYEQVYLIRNERKYHMYSFNEGKRFEPDYILIIGNQTTLLEQQHIFIEPKGQHLREKDKWKEDFLLQLKADSRCIAYPDIDNYSVMGLPFYTHGVKEEQFKEAFENLYKDM